MTERMRQVLDALARLEERGTDPATPNEIAWEAGFREGPQRHGHGGKGGWSGQMAPAQHIIFSLNALRNRELVAMMGRRDGLSGMAYMLTDAGREARREHP
jgi:hypothetical protein